MTRVISILLLSLLSLPTFAQDAYDREMRLDEIKIYFGQGSCAVDLEFQQNGESISHFSDLYNTLSSDSLAVIKKIKIDSYASPEGGRTYNNRLSERRSNSLYEYLTDTLSVPDSLIEMGCSGIDWEMLQEFVEESDMEYRDEVLHILKSVPDETWRRLKPTDPWMSLVDSRNKHLMDLRYGIPYRYMFSNIYPKLRTGSVVTLYFKREQPPVIEPETTPEVIEKEEPKVEPALEPVEIVEPEPSEPIIKPLLALKSNLLYDVVTAINIELEVPIGDRWSVAAEWIFPWWSSCGKPNGDWQNDSKRNTFQLLQGNIEGKYWFGDRSDRLVMTGWYGGLYGGSGRYDLERKSDGNQGEFYVVGLSGGYAHTINKCGSLRMEYSLGLGYMQTNYDKYGEHLGIDDRWHTIRRESGRQSWFGPTKAKVSLVWMLNRKVNWGK